MTEMTRYEHGVPSWVDLGSPDPAKAAEFYTALFGWDVQQGPPEAGGYAIAHLNGRTVAGIGPQQNPGPPVWASYVNVDSADDVATKVSANGGMVFMAPFDVMDVGRMGIFSDPLGAVFGVWQPGTHPGAGVLHEPGALTWIELVTTEVKRADTFYRAVFGWDSETHSGDAMSYTEFKVGGQSIAGMMAKPPMMPAEVPPHWMVYFATDDPDATVATATKLGGSVVMPPTDIEPGRFAVINDPMGAVFSVIKLAEHVGT